MGHPVSTHPTPERTTAGIGRRRPLAAISALAVAPGMLAAAGTATGLGLPCPSQTLLGLDCPLCGGTRATAALADGSLMDAVDQNVLVVALVLPAVVALSLVAAWCLATGSRPTVPQRVTRALLAVGVGTLGVFMLARNLPVDALVWLRSDLQL